MVGRIPAPLGFVNKPKLIREGRAASCVLRPPSAKELQAQGTRPAAHTSSDSPKANPEKQESPSELDRDSKQQWCDEKCFTHTRVESMNTTKTVHLKTFTLGGKLKGLRSWPTSWLTCSWGTHFHGQSFFQTFSKHTAIAADHLPDSGVDEVMSK